jgi:hypothetical protein
VLACRPAQGVAPCFTAPTFRTFQALVGGFLAQPGLRTVTGILPDAPIRLVADDSLFKRTGRKIHGAGWRYDPTATGRTRTAWGNTWVVVGVLVALPLVPHRRVCLPVGARLWQPGGPSKLDLATCWSGCWPPAIPTASST